MKQIFQTLKLIPVGKTVRVAITSSSMEPTFLKLAPVIVTRCSFSTVSAGMVIAFYIEGIEAIVIHRIIKLKQDGRGMYAITRGDANTGNDPWIVRDEQIIGFISENQR